MFIKPSINALLWQLS